MISAQTIRHWTQDRLLRGLIWGLLRLPYRWRVPLCGWAVRRMVAPFAGYRRRALENLAMIWPDRPLAERQRIADAAIDNAGRTLIENYSTAEFTARMARIDPQGPGYAALTEAAARGQSVILVSGHFGNYEAARAALVARGFAIGGLYRPLSNPFFNDHYVRTMQAFGGPIFAQGRRGTAGFVRHLREGGQLVLLFDQHVPGAPLVPFLGHPARTATSAADLALKYDALLIPFFATRQADGLSFRVDIEAPIPVSTAQDMTALLSDSLARRVRQDPGQWFWIHRRWKH